MTEITNNSPGKYLLCSYDQKELAIPVNLVSEIINLSDFHIVSVPYSSSECLGILNHRGDIVTVLDFWREFSLSENILDIKKLQGIVFSHQNELFVIPVEAVLNINELSEAITSQAEILIPKDDISDKNTTQSGYEDIGEKKLFLLPSKEIIFNTSRQIF